MTAFDTVNLSPAMGGMATDGKRSIGYKNPLGPICVTQQTAALDTLQLRLDDTSMLQPDWQIKRARLSNGTLDFFATRFDPDSGHSELRITGSITPTLTDLITVYDADEFRPGKGRTHSVWQSRNERVGNCTPDEATNG